MLRSCLKIRLEAIELESVRGEGVKRLVCLLCVAHINFILIHVESEGVDLIQCAGDRVFGQNFLFFLIFNAVKLVYIWVRRIFLTVTL